MNSSISPPSAEQWLEHKPTIWRLYIIGEMPLKVLVQEVVKMMRRTVT